MNIYKRERSVSDRLSGKYVAAMEDVLVLYAMPYDARYLTVCLDEKPVVLHAEVRTSLPPAPGHVERRDYEYERHARVKLGETLPDGPSLTALGMSMPPRSASTAVICPQRAHTSP